MSGAVIAMAASAGLVSLIVSFLVLKGGILDFPNARLSHSAPTPRGGGLGVLAGMGAGAIIASLFPLGAGALGGGVPGLGALGGGGLTHVFPGEETVLRWKAIKPGVFTYHCAPGGAMIPYHVCHGMNGAIMVLPRRAGASASCMTVSKKPVLAVRARSPRSVGAPATLWSIAALEDGCTRLEAAGFERVSIIEPSAATPLYRVRVGPFDDPRRRRSSQLILTEHGFAARAVER